MNTGISELTSAISDRFSKHRSEEAFTVAISGIDAAGKGYISRLMEKELSANGHRVALINIDPWQNPVSLRLWEENAAENFYEHVFRRDELFERLILPLKRNRSIGNAR